MGAATNSLPCSYCGLPTAAKSLELEGDREGTSRAVFCCLGCRIANDIMRGDDPAAGNRQALTRLGLAIFFTMNVMVFTLVLWTWNVHDLADDSRVDAFREILRYGCFLFSAPVLILLGSPLVEATMDAWHQRRFTTDVLLLLGVCAAFCYSIASLTLGLPDVYFEVACMILVAVTLGKWLEATAKHKANQALQSLRKLLPETVRRVHANVESIVPLEEVRPCDSVRVLPGERIPVDGILETSEGIVDEQVVTGESLPVNKQAGHNVYSGTLNLAGELRIHVSSAHDEGTIARLIRAVESATNSKCRTIRIADQLAAWFVPLIIVASLAAVYLNYEHGAQHATMAAISVVLIACPCALGIATPLALWVAINAAARRGVLFRNGDAVIALANLRSLALDKTGTVTQGEVFIVAEAFEPGTEHETRKLALSLADSSNHLLARAVFAHLTNTTAVSNAPTHKLTGVYEYAGKGITGSIQLDTNSALSAQPVAGESTSSQSASVMLGSLRLAAELDFHLSDALGRKVEQHREQAVVCLGAYGEVQGLFFLGETLRPEASAAIDQLRLLGLELVILTGDNAHRAKRIEELTNVAAISELLPEDKAVALKGLPKPTGMVGDGINDAIALASADVGIALDCGADVSREAADVCLMGSTLQNLPWAVSLARATRRTVRRNLLWAVGYNVCGIAFAVTGNLNPIVAAMAMIGSSLFVLTSSLRLSAAANGGGSAPLHNAPNHFSKRPMQNTDEPSSGIDTPPNLPAIAGVTND